MSTKSAEKFSQVPIRFCRVEARSIRRTRSNADFCAETTGIASRLPNIVTCEKKDGKKTGWPMRPFDPGMWTKDSNTGLRSTLDVLPFVAVLIAPAWYSSKPNEPRNSGNRRRKDLFHRK